MSKYYGTHGHGYGGCWVSYQATCKETMEDFIFSAQFMIMLSNGDGGSELRP